MKYLFILGSILVSCIAFRASAQHPATLKYCGATEAEKKFLDENPQLVPLIREENEKLDEYTREYSEKEASLRSGTVYVIPVVFHILHDYGPENISDDQVYDAMRIMNEDFRKQNADTNLTISAFKPIAWDAEIEFRLAQKDPNGNCTNGIDRIWTMETYVGDDDSKLNQWPRNKYLNIWVAKTLNNGAAGYSYNPASTMWDPSIDGVMILHSYVGSIGTGYSGTDGALTHEIGHWLNLNHPWGSTNSPGVSCGDDQVNDTPETKGWTSCNLNGSVCNPPVIENVQNFMDYSYCETMYTQGQTTRMRAALTSGTAGRNNLWSASNLSATGINVSPFLCAADFKTASTTVCAGQPVQFFDASYNTTPVSWNWTFDWGYPSTSTQQDPTVYYFTPGTYPVSLSAGNGTNTFSTTKNAYITVLPAPGKSVPYYEGFEISSFPNSDWMISNPDNSGYKWDLKTGVAYSGSNCLKMNNYGNDTIQKDDLLSNTIDLSNYSSATITFRVAYCQRSSGTLDKLSLYVSTNCGQTWSPRFAKAGSALATSTTQSSSFTPSSSSQWAEFSASLTSAYLTENFRMKFTFDCDGGNNLYLDDINISGVFNPVPILVSPATNSLNVSSSPKLDWKSAGNVTSYEYQLDITSAFTSGNLITGSNPFVTLASDGSDTEFQAANLTPGTKYYWRVRSVTSGTPSSWSSTWNFTVSANGVGIESVNSGFQPGISIFPNPANGSIFIEFSFDRDEKISAGIYDILGKEVSLFDSKDFPAGNHSMKFSSAGFAPGLYFVKISSGDFSFVKKIIISQ